MSKYRFEMTARAIVVDDDGVESVISTSSPFSFDSLGYDDLTVVEKAYIAGVEKMGYELVIAGKDRAIAKLADQSLDII